MLVISVWALDKSLIAAVDVLRSQGADAPSAFDAAGDVAAGRGWLKTPFSCSCVWIFVVVCTAATTDALGQLLRGQLENKEIKMGSRCGHHLRGIPFHWWELLTEELGGFHAHDALAAWMSFISFEDRFDISPE